ncbi:hypothetical protein K5E40_03625 [Pseudomonas baetica]|uniref:hypothetical protein n=1 Tax=Pseudomonas baetica TaxID=674054 RepID=UPI001C8B6986|nr:hypothetical protein [Pseudomonas baetica]MBX9404764.1 hypothetical protein [Pseudomonas baetica]
MNEQMLRTGKALEVLWAQFHSARVVANTKQSWVKRFVLSLKTKALIKHDRILRGEE